MARTSNGLVETWPSDGRRPAAPREPSWETEHGAQFWRDKSGRRHFRTLSDAETWFHAEHGSCERCDGTGFEQFERGGHSYARRCELLPPL